MEFYSTPYIKCKTSKQTKQKHNMQRPKRAQYSGSDRIDFATVEYSQTSLQRDSKKATRLSTTTIIIE